MDRFEIEGHTLGDRHRHYNKILKETKQTREIRETDDDVYNLLRVDVASKNRDVDYILGLLKGNNMLFVSRAIKQCPWLITDNQHAHIINPEYLHSELFPSMMSKAARKLMLQIRLNLRDEARVESFFNYYEKRDLDTALKWLPHCSVPFMTTQFEKYESSIRTDLLKRLCETNHNILKMSVTKGMGNGRNFSAARALEATMFLLNTHTEFYLDLVEMQTKYDLPKFNQKQTKFILKTCPERIHKMFDKYADIIDLPTFAKYLDPNNIQEFLLKQARNEMSEHMGWVNYDSIQHFIKRMPQEQRLQFINDIFLKPVSNQNKLYRSVTLDGFHLTKTYNWCQFIPFDTALREIKEDIKNSRANEKKDMLCSLVRVAGRNLQNLETLLQYYNDDLLNNASNYNCEFVKYLCLYTTVHKYNNKCWILFNNIFSSMKVDYYESCYVFNIIMYKVLKKEEVPEPIIKQYNYDETFINYRNSMTSEEQSRLFEYLYKNLVKKIDEESRNEENMDFIKSMLFLLNDWNKHLADYPYVLNKIRDLIKVKLHDLSWVYDINKSWRKCMFEESIVICPSQRTCINALKHDPSLLSRSEKEVSALRCNDTISLTQLLRKLKLYWPRSLASEWAAAYKGRIIEPHGHKSLVRGLSALLPQRDFLLIVNQYKPEKEKIIWAGNDDIILSLQRFIAKNMHLACPQPDPHTVLQYAKGDYLQYALPSVNAVFYNLCIIRFRQCMLELLDAPVSVQKHGIRLAFSKLHSDELQRIFIDFWKNSKNVSIRAVLFKVTYNKMCKEKNPEKEYHMWDMLSVFIDALSFEEDKTIYDLLAEVQNVPLKTRPLYLMKGYKFLKSFLPVSGVDRNKYEEKLNSLISEIVKLYEYMSSEFVGDILKDYIRAVSTNQKTEEFVPNDIVPLLVPYLLYSESEGVQVQRFDVVFTPILNLMISQWRQNKEKSDMGNRFMRLLNSLKNNLKNVVIKNMALPCTVYGNIKKKLEESLPTIENYGLLREWMFTVAFVTILNENAELVERSQYEGKSDDMLWDAVCERAVPTFAKKCVEFLKDDITRFFPCIYEHFSHALSSMLLNLFNTGSQSRHRLEVLRHMLTEDVTQTYLVAITISPEFAYDEDKWLETLHRLILSHPSLEVKMHFYHKYKNIKYRI